jgi:hypothetical protein
LGDPQLSGPKCLESESPPPAALEIKDLQEKSVVIFLRSEVHTVIFKDKADVCVPPTGGICEFVGPHDGARIRRDSREFRRIYFSLVGTVWSALWAAVAIGATIAVSPDHSVTAQVAIGVGLFLFGIAWAMLSLWRALWLRAPSRQRDDARAELAIAREAARFPRGGSRFEISAGATSTSGACSSSRSRSRTANQPRG